MYLNTGSTLPPFEQSCVKDIIGDIIELGGNKSLPGWRSTTLEKAGQTLEPAQAQFEAIQGYLKPLIMRYFSVG